MSKLNVHVVVSPPDSLTQGSRLLLPHISTLLQYLSGVVRNSDRLKKKKFRAQVAKELNILSKLVFCLDENTFKFFLTVCKTCFLSRLVKQMFECVTLPLSGSVDL